MPNRLSHPSFRALPLALCAVTLPVLSAYAQQTPPLGANGTIARPSVQMAPPPGLVLFNKALAATKQKNYAEAERLYRLILKDQPDAAAVWANLGLLQAYQGRMSEAENSMTKAVQKSPQTPMFRAQLAAFQFRLGKNEVAEKNARQTLKQEPKNPLALASLSDVLMRQRRYEEALPLLQTLRSQQKTPDLRTNINVILALNGVGKTAQALTLARKQVALAPKTPSSYLVLGDTLRLSGDLKGAQAAYAKAQALDPKSVGAQQGRAVVAALSGDHATALKLLDQRIAQNPNDPILIFQRGYLLYTMPDTSAPDSAERRNRLSQAEQAFYRAATLDPKNTQYFTYTGLSALAQGDDHFRNADAMLRSALNLQPHNSMARLGLAYLAEKQGKADVALKQYKAILEYEPKNKDARRGVAGVYYATGKKDAAFAEMRSIARMDTRDTLVLSELGSWLSANKRPVEAQAVYEQVLMRNPKDEGAYLALGRLATEMTPPQPAQAIKWYREALKQIPTSTNAAMLLGQALTADNKNEEAMDVYRHLLQEDPTSGAVRWQLAVMLHQSAVQSRQEAETLRKDKKEPEALAKEQEAAKRDDASLKEMQAIRLVDNDPNRMAYMLGPARIYLSQKKYPEALAMLRQLAQVNPGEDEVKYTLAEALRQDGKTSEAETLLAQMRDRKPTRDEEGPSVRPVLLLGDMYEQANRLDDAGSAYEEALRRDPTNLVALLGLERVRVRQDKPDGALKFMEQMALSGEKEPLLPAIGSVRQLHVQHKTMPEYTAFTQRLIQKYPGDWTAVYVRARALTDETAGYDITPAARQEAIGLYQQILVKDAKNADAEMQLALQYEALKQKPEAVAAYQQLLKWDPQNTQALEGLKRLGGSVTPAAAPVRPVGTTPTTEPGKSVTKQ